MAPEKKAHSGPVRERARDELRECQSLIQGLFEAHGLLLTAQYVHRSFPYFPADKTQRGPVSSDELILALM